MKSSAAADKSSNRFRSSHWTIAHAPAAAGHPRSIISYRKLLGDAEVRHVLLDEEPLSAKMTPKAERGEAGDTRF